MKLIYTLDKTYDKKLTRGLNIKIEFEKMYRATRPYLYKAKASYQASWDTINDDFSKYIEHQTGYSWFYQSYQCVVSIVHRGISNWGHAPIIVRWWRENPYSQRRITAHELILSHYFEIYRHHYSDKGLTDKQVWALAEIAAFALTSLPKGVTRFWPWDFAGYYTEHNYPQIVTLQKQLKETFLKRKSFDEYMLKGFHLVRKYKL